MIVQEALKNNNVVSFYLPLRVLNFRETDSNQELTHFLLVCSTGCWMGSNAGRWGIRARFHSQRDTHRWLHNYNLAVERPRWFSYLLDGVQSIYCLPSFLFLPLEESSFSILWVATIGVQVWQFFDVQLRIIKIKKERKIRDNAVMTTKVEA